MSTPQPPGIPDEPETINGFEDEDGCPDKGRVLIKRGKLEILDKIYFETDKTDIKPESAPAIDEIAKFLKQDAKAIVYVVGHTDNVGGYEQNMGLSQRRAEAVVKELTTKHGIPATRLKAAGSGPLAPMAPNETEEGRAKNRRVELVKQ